MWRRSRRVGLAAVLAIALLGCAGTGPVATPTPPPPDPVTTTVREDGLVVSLTFERPTLETGATMRVHGFVRNVSGAPIAWVDTGCDWWDSFALDGPPLADPPAGRAWTGTAGWIKHRSIPPRTSFASVIPDRVLEGGQANQCSAPSDPAWLEPGVTLTAEMAFRATVTHRVPAPLGTYRLTFSFFSLGPTPPHEIDPQAIPQNAVSVAGAFEVTGEPFTGIPASIALDRALEDPRVAAWLAPLERHHFDSRAGLGIALLDGRWVFLASTPDEDLRVELRPSDGAVISVTITPRD